LELVLEQTAWTRMGNPEAARCQGMRLVLHRPFGSLLGFGLFGDLADMGAVALGLILKFPDGGGQSLDKDK